MITLRESPIRHEEPELLPPTARGRKIKEHFKAQAALAYVLECLGEEIAGR